MSGGRIEQHKKTTMPVMIETVKVYTIQEVAREVGLTAASIRNYVHAGRIRYAKVGGTIVFSEQAVREFIAALRGAPEPQHP
jgi:excisionase family DNA binding protein